MAANGIRIHARINQRFLEILLIIAYRKILRLKLYVFGEIYSTLQ